MGGLQVRGRVTALGFGAVGLLAALGAGAAAWLGTAGPAPADPRPALPRPAAPVPARAVPPRAGPVLGPFERRWVAVPVATVWDRPGAARPEDGPAVGAGPDVQRWVTSLDYRQKLGLDDLLATQALFEQPVVVYGHEGGWDHVLVPGQTGAVYPFGVAGWVPDVQLTAVEPPRTPARATVAVPRLTVGGTTFSYGTRLAVEGDATGPGAAVTVVLPAGRFPVPAAALRAGELPRSGSRVVAEAERFLGLPYLWAGTSAFGYDCSGLTYSVYRQFGVTLARDAADQAVEGTPVAASQLRPGDLVFFAFGGPVDHVGIYAGGGMMIHSPETGAAVQLVPMWGTPLARAFVGARRYLPAA